MTSKHWQQWFLTVKQQIDEINKSPSMILISNVTIFIPSIREKNINTFLLKTSIGNVSKPKCKRELKTIKRCLFSFYIRFFWGLFPGVTLLHSCSSAALQTLIQYFLLTQNLWGHLNSGVIFWTGLWTAPAPWTLITSLLRTDINSLSNTDVPPHLQT